jgi:PAS domain S-box-containing protein
MNAASPKTGGPKATTSDTTAERCEAQWRLDEQRLQALVQLNEMEDASLRDITDFALEQAVRLTRSTIGYLAFMSEDEKVLTMHSWSKEAMEECAIRDKPLVYPVAETGLWGEAVRQRKAVITNDYAAPNPLKKGHPPGHVPIRRHMNAPVFEDQRIVVVAGVGNKDAPYDESDVAQLRLLMIGMWRLIQRKRAKEELVALNESLEQRVSERTAQLAEHQEELRRANERLAHERDSLHTLLAEHKQAEEALSRSETKFRTLYDSTRDAVMLLDERGFFDCNQATLAVFGCATREEFCSKHPADLSPPAQPDGTDSRTLAGRRIATALEKGSHHFEWVHTRADTGETFPAEVLLSAMELDGKQVLQAVVRDITERKRMEARLLQARDEAEEANRTKSRFLANMSHELRTPLNSVIGFANILLKNKPGNLNPSDLNYLERIQANGKHLLILINEILDLSKIEAHKVELQMSPVALDRLVRDTLAQEEALVRDKPVELLADLPGQVAPILTDADKLKQILINLIGNALKFTERGNVTVRVLTDPADHHPIRLDVCDSGIGIPKDKLGVIFDAFQQAEEGTARKYGGTGLGLTISKALCRLMDYRIEVTSEVGRGSTFSVILQAAPPATDALPRLASLAEGAPVPLTASPLTPAPKPSGPAGKVILVIDDEADSRALLTQMIEEAGCHVVSADSGELGLLMARKLRPHLIATDLLMPGMDGWQVLRAIKTDPDLRSIPTVIISVVAGENRAGIFGAVEILQKPVERGELLAVLKKAGAF